MKTQALKQALDKWQFDAAIGGARRDEEKSRAKERIFSFRSEQHRWDPKNQRPELWNLYNTRIHKGESVRVFPISNWTELDVWLYIFRENIPVPRSEEHTSELQSLMRISYAVFCLQKKTKTYNRQSK